MGVITGAGHLWMCKPENQLVSNEGQIKQNLTVWPEDLINMQQFSSSLSETFSSYFDITNRPTHSPNLEDFNPSGLWKLPTAVDAT